ncbi:MAG: HAMP domain-containing histidine kinase [Ruminococcaceae bacterium]|nr:HAMP domain-containing histidine kinase [Oscillospiraceae bacterium]
MNTQSTGALRKFGLFLAVIVTLVLAVGCVFGAWLFVSEDFYTTPKDRLLAQYDRTTIMNRDARSILERVLFPDYYQDEPAELVFSDSATNLRYIMTDGDGNVVSANVPLEKQYEEEIPQDKVDSSATAPTPKAFEAEIPVGSDEERAELWDGWTTFVWTVTESHDPDNPSDRTMDYSLHTVPRGTAYNEQGKPFVVDSEKQYVFHGKLAEGLPAEDSYRFMHELYNGIYDVRYAVFPVGAVSLILCVLCFILLMCASARRPGIEGVYPGPFHRVPFDLMAAVGFIVFGITISFLNDLSHSSGNRFLFAVFIGVSAVAGSSVLLGLSMSAAGRIKAGTMVRNNVTVQAVLLLWKVLCLLGRGLKRVGSFLLTLIRGIPLIPKTLLILAGLSILDPIVFAGTHPDFEVYFIFHVLLGLVLIPAILWIALSMRRLEKGGQSLAAGNLSHQVDTKGMFPVLKKHGENLNAIGEGINRAVEERMKSERMKTELITNVSHDLKTPLTSIVNYAGLIAGEDCDNPKIREYSEVLLRQSERLKRLIEDLVEASKAQTGTLDVELSPTDVCVFFEQAAGEYESRLTAAGMTLLSSRPDHPVTILADGRRLWRVFDNLMNNIVKYGQPGTRVYVTLEDIHDFAVMTFRNVSRDPLNLSPDELMERFVRGDVSRNSATEGNGLGLSIAKSLTELQGGALNLSIDGDLFKIVLHFPKIKTPPSSDDRTPSLTLSPPAPPANGIPFPAAQNRISQPDSRTRA